MNSVSLLIASLWTSFVNPDEACKPWTYYFWSNSLTDKETITLELADIHRLARLSKKREKTPALPEFSLFSVSFASVFRLFCIMGHGHRNGKRRTSQLSAA